MSVPASRRSEALWLILATALYVALTSQLTTRRPLWFDELLTVGIAGQPHFSDIGAALAQGPDQHPPLIYCVVRFSRAVLGSGEWATRFPVMTAYWLYCLALYAFASRRLGAAAGSVALVVPLVCGSYIHSYDARPYALALAGGGWGLVCWQRATEHARRAAWLAGLILSLAVSVSSHYFALFLFLPLMAGEALRTTRRRAIDWPVWFSFAAPWLCLLAYLPWLRAGRRLAAALWGDAERFWARPQWTGLWLTYVELFAPALVPLLVGYFFLLVARRKSLGGVDRAGFPAHELAAAIAYLAAPLGVFLIGKLVTGIYMSRYALGTTAGFALLAALGARKESRGDPRAVACLVAAILLGSGLNTWRVSRQYARPDAELAVLLSRTKDDGAVIAVASPLRFSELEYYSPGPLRARLRFFRDPAEARRHPDFVPEMILPYLAQWMPLKVEPYEALGSRYRNLLVYSFIGSSTEWLSDRLRAQGWRVDLVAKGPAHCLYRAAAP